MRYILAITMLLLGFSPAPAWDIKAMNDTINQTNFIVGTGCSGTLISLKYKLILTNYHCIGGNISSREKEIVGSDGTIKKVRVEELSDVDVSQKAYQGYRLVGQTSYQSVIVGHKQTRDIALLQIRADTIPQTISSRILPDGKSVKRGERAYGVGNPRGLDASITIGIISSVTRMLRPPWADGGEVPYIQYSGGLTGGNSGGALYNDEGYLIGIPGARLGDTVLGFAVSYTVVRNFLDGICYGSVWNSKAKPHDECVADKKAKAKKK